MLITGFATNTGSFARKNPGKKHSFTMVVGAFPVIKLATLAVRQISKPIAKRVEQVARNIPFIRRYICIPVGQCK